jgi:sialidase-1
VNTVDSGLTNCVTYYYAVFSRDGDEEWNDMVQAGSNADTGMPDIPGAAVGYWRFNEGSGASATDSSGMGNDGVLHGASWALGGSADGSHALSFGGDDYVDLGMGLDLGSGSFSIEAWFKSSSGATYQTIIGRGLSAGLWWTVRLTDGIVTACFYDGAVKGKVESASTYNDGSWHHVAVVRTAGEGYELFVDGALVGTAGSNGDVNSFGSVHIGSFPGLTQYFDGMIDEVRVHDRALDPSEFNLAPIP